ncbi:MAG: PAS domain-containing protein [Bacteroidota bacterium]
MSLAPLTEALLAAVPDAALVCDAGGHIRAANAAAARLLDADLPGADARNAATPENSLAGRSVFAFLDEALLRDAPDGEPFSARVGARLVHVHKTTQPAGLALVLRVAESLPLHRDVERLALGLTESVRGPLASIRAAIETLTEYPGMEEDLAAQFTTIIREQAVALSEQLEESAAALAEATTPLSLPEHLRAEALGARTAAALAEALAVRVDAAPAAASDAPDAVVRVEWSALERGLVHLATRTVHAVQAEALAVQLNRAGQMAALDLCWRGAPVRPERLDRWADEPLAPAGGASAESLRGVVERHGGALWARDADAAGHAAVRLLLPARMPANGRSS